MIYRLVQGLAAVVLMIGAIGAGCETSPNLYTPLTDPVTVAVINATPYRAIFTGGAYDPLDQNTTPQGDGLLVASAAEDPQNQGVIAMKTLGCRRALTIGAADFVQLIKDKKVTVTEKRALVTGVYFSDAPAGSPDEANPTVGTAEPLTILQGVDYPCGSYVIFRLVEDATAPGGFRVQFDGVIF